MANMKRFTSILVGVLTTATCTTAVVTTEETASTFDPPVAFTQYNGDGGCEDDDDDDATISYQGGVTSVNIMRWGEFCVGDIDSNNGGVTSYTKVNIDCDDGAIDGVIEYWMNCTDASCSDCEFSLSGESPWSDFLPNLPLDYCYSFTSLIDGNLTSSRFRYDATDSLNNDVQAYLDIVNGNSCINSWQPFIEEDPDKYDGIDDDTFFMPLDAVICPDNKPEDFCNCKRDCVEYPSFCSCDEAVACCVGQDEIYDADGNGIPESFIQCPDTRDICDCSFDCFFNRQQCMCEEAQACCSTKVNCPDSDPHEQCNCSSDCIIRPEFCTCEEAQSCCANANSLAAVTEELIEIILDPESQDEDCLTMLEIICDVSDDHTVLCALFTELSSESQDIVQSLLEEQDVKQWTLFAPTDDAFAAIEDELGTLTEEEIGRIALFHIIGGGAERDDVPDDNFVSYEQLECTKIYQMLSGDNSRTKCVKDGDTDLLEKFQKGGGNKKNGNLPRIIDADIMGCNGIVHVIDGVMLPNFVDQFD